MAEFTREQLIAAACSRIDFAKQMLCGNPLPLAKRNWEIELSLSEIALAALTAEPFMHGIVDPDGMAHMDENCVALKPYALDEEVDALNDECPEPPFNVVPLYRLPLLEGLK